MALNERWHILGAGAMGCIFADYLAQSRRDPVLLLRNQSNSDSDASAQQITIERSGQRHHRVVKTSACEAPQPISHLLITTKAYDVLDAVSSVASRLTPDAQLVLLVNGLGLREALLANHPDLQLYMATTTEGAYRLDQYRVKHAGIGITRLGKPDHDQPPTWFKSWPGGAAHCQWESDIESALWQKLAINCAINPLTAINRCHNGQLTSTDNLTEKVRHLCREIALVSRAAGYAEIADSLYERVCEVIRTTAENRSSMLQDVLAGRRTEAQYISGHLQKIARQHSIATPRHDALYEKLREYDSSAYLS